jgi:hypothetical protein
VRACLARSLFAVGAVSALCACAATGPLGAAAETTSSGAWRISKGIDSVTGVKTANIQLVSDKTSHGGLTFPGGAGLQLGCFKGQPVVHFEFGFQIGSKSDSEITYRFDEKPAHAIKPHILRGLEMMVIEDKAEATQFMNELATANRLYVTINSLAKGSSAAAFNVAGAPAAIELIRTACHT